MLEGGGGEVENDRVQGGVEGAEEQRVYPPGRAVILDKSHNVGDVEGGKADNKVEQGGHCQANGPLLPAGLDVGQGGQYPDQMDVAKKADEERDEEEQNAHLQAGGKEEVQLGLGELFIAYGDVGRVQICLVWALHLVLDDVDAAAVGTGQEPAGEADQNRVDGPVFQLVLDGVGHPQIALHTDGCQEEGAAVDAAVVAEASDWA